MLLGIDLCVFIILVNFIWYSIEWGIVYWNIDFKNNIVSNFYVIVKIFIEYLIRKFILSKSKFVCLCFKVRKVVSF